MSAVGGQSSVNLSATVRRCCYLTDAVISRPVVAAREQVVDVAATLWCCCLLLRQDASVAANKLVNVFSRAKFCTRFNE